MADPELVVLDVPERSRYEARLGDEVPGYVSYQPAQRLVVLTHTEVQPQYEGLGIGGRLVRAVLDDVRARGLHVLPLCPFVRSWLEDHPDYQDVVFSPPPSQVTD